MTDVSATTSRITATELAALDDKLSKRFIELDPEGYYIIFLDRDAGLICAAHYTNTISEKGLALNPETGEPLPVRGKVERKPTQVYTGRTAKELGMQLTEGQDPAPLSRFDHALYLGRELVRAELALLGGAEYVQD